MQCRICTQCMRSRFNSWIRKIPWRREWLPTSVVLPREFHVSRGAWQAIVHGVTELDMTEWLRFNYTYTHRYLPLLMLFIFWCSDFSSGIISLVNYLNIRSEIIKPLAGYPGYFNQRSRLYLCRHYKYAYFAIILLSEIVTDSTEIQIWRSTLNPP